MSKKIKNNWSAHRNRKIREKIRELRDEGVKPSDMYKKIGKEFNISVSRVRCIEYGVKAG